MWPFSKKSKTLEPASTVDVKQELREPQNHPNCRHVWQDDGFHFCTVPNETIPQHCIQCGDFRVTQRPRDFKVDFSSRSDKGRQHPYGQPVDDSLIDAMFAGEIVTFIDSSGKPVWKAIIDSDSSLMANKL